MLKKTTTGVLENLSRLRALMHLPLSESLRCSWTSLWCHCDLDNTLYDTKKYYLGAFHDIANFLHQEHSINKEEAYNKLVEFWIEKTSMYPHLFDDLVTYFNITNESVKTFVKIFNEHKIENNQLYSDSIPILKKLKKSSAWR